MIKRVLKTAAYVLAPLGVLVLLGFAAGQNRSAVCTELRVEIAGDARFVTQDDVINEIARLAEIPEGKTFQNISLKRIEELVDAMYFVENAEVYRNIDGSISVKIEQREPIARIVNSVNESYYLDRNGKLMQTSRKYTARVPMVTGRIYQRYSPGIVAGKYADIQNPTRNELILNKIVEMLNYIEKDDFLSSWIDQLYVTQAGEFELIPRNGAHVIEFGDTDQLDAKFSKLITFYKDGLTHVGWNHYERINLKYKNQVVCSK